MCLKACISVALYLVCFLTLTDGLFLPVFFRKQHPQTPALNNAQWASYQPTGTLSSLQGSSPNGNLNVNSIGGSAPAQTQQIPQGGTYKEYNPFQQPQTVVTPLHQVQVSPMHAQYGYDASSQQYQMASYPQFQSAFHSVQLVPCLCPISKEVIDQQTQQYQQHLQPVSSGSLPPSSTAESGSSDVTVKGSQKVTS